MGANFVQKRGVEVMRSVIDGLKTGKGVELSGILRLVNDFVVTCKANDERFVNLARVKDPVNYVYSHPINVCIYSMAVGSRLKFNEKQLTRLGIAALLHDIGEVKLPDRMLVKAAKYTESELSAMQRHPTLGYELLKRDPSIPDDVLMGILHHHERIDGSGYPSGHPGKFIHPLGKIIGVAETFDAMTTNKGKSDAVTQSDALRTLYSLAGKHYEANVVKALISLLGMYPMGSLVRLSGGQLAVVMGQNKADLSKPKVIVITDGTGQSIEPYLVNLYGDVVARQIMFAENPYMLGIDTNQYVADALKGGVSEDAGR